MNEIQHVLVTAAALIELVGWRRGTNHGPGYDLNDAVWAAGDAFDSGRALTLIGDYLLSTRGWTGSPMGWNDRPGRMAHEVPALLRAVAASAAGDHIYKRVPRRGDRGKND